MPIPDSMDDLSATINSNSPAGTETPGNGDDYIRALSAIMRRTNAKGSDIASAATTDIGAATGEFVDVTGTTTITSLGTIDAGIVRDVRFTGALTLTHNATSLILPGSANITTANGDVARFRSLGSGNWKCVGYIRQNGTPVVLAGTATSDITMSGASMIWSKGADVASASALPLITDGNYFDVTGTTTITSFNSMGVGTWIALQFDAALTLTHNATDLILPCAANITTAAGDHGIFIEYAAGDWRCVSYIRADGKTVIGALTSGTATALTGTSVNFTGIPSWVKQITISFESLSSSGTSTPLFQIGDSGGIENTGYLGASFMSSSAATTVTNFTAGIGIASSAAANVMHGSITFTLIDSATNLWAASGGGGRSDAALAWGTGGSKSLSGTLDRVRATFSNGTDTFDGSGTINIVYH